MRKARFTAFLLLAVLFMSLAVPVSADAIGGSLYIGDLAAGTATTNSLAINWTTPSGTAPAPGAAYYDIRYSTVPITDTSSFNAAVPLGGVPAPLAAGSGQSFTINGLACGTKYYFAITAYNAAKSGVLSNSASGSTTACSLTFSVAAAITGGSSFYQIQKGDFNNDGKPDIVVSVTNTKSIIFYPGTGSGTFGAPVTSSGVTGTYPMKPIAGDFNGDGKLDLAVPNFSDNTVSILFGDGNGNFTSHGTFPTGSGGPQEAVVGDFNRDGKLDIAIAMWDTGDIKIYLGDGTGTFAHSSTFHVFDDARLLALRTADFDGDGIPDLVVADYGYGPSSYKNRIRVMKGNGSGGFSSTDADIYTVGLQPQSIAIGDLNGDGKPDIVCVSMDGTVAVLLNNGDGTFAPATTYAVGVQLYSVNIGDFNGDGKPDILVSGGNSNSLFLLTGNGDGTFNTAVSFPVVAGIIAVVVDDFDRDGKPDAMVLAGDQTSIYSALNTTAWSPAGNFLPPANYSSGYHPNYVTAGDLNGDGIQDVVTTSQYNRNFFSVRLGNADGTLGAEVQYGGVLEPHMPLLADFNGDGILDLAIAEYGGDRVSIRLGNRDGTFQAPLYASVGSGPVSLVVGDFNGDGKLDLGVGHWGSNWFAILIGNGDGTFQPAVLHDIGAKSFHPVVADFHGNGKLDIVAGNYELNSLSLFTGSGDGTFTHSRIDLPGNSNVPYLGDFNRDGKPDLAVTSNAYGGSILILLGNGNGTFQSPIVNAVGRGDLAIGDLDRDGKLDIMFADYANTSATVLRGNGDGTFAEPVRFVTAAGTADISLADFNRDGRPDIITSNTDSDSISILRNTAPLPTVPQQGLVALWRAENNALDSIGGNHGTLNGGATYAAGRYGQAFSFDGSSGYVQLTDSADLKPSFITVSAWINLSSSPSTAAMIFDHESAEPWYGYGMSIVPGNRLNVDVYAGSSTQNLTGSTVLAPNIWYHVAMTYDGANVKTYINGIEEVSVPNSGPLNYSVSVNPRIGKRAISGTPYSFPGLIDEVAIYNRALSATEIRQIASAMPNAFSFTAQTGMPLGTTIVSNPITVTGISIAAPISITDGQYAVSTDGGASWSGWTSAAGTVSLGEQVKVSQTSSVSNSTMTTATLTIGGVNGTFNVTTAASGDPNASGLVAWWRAENNAYDSVGGNNGTLMNGTTYAAGKVGQAFSFDGIDDYVEVPNFITTFTQFSFSFWMNITSFTDHNYMASFCQGNSIVNTFCFFAGDNSGGTFGFEGRWQDGSYFDLRKDISFGTGVWKHIAVTYDGSTLSQYVDGVLDNHESYTGKTLGNNAPFIVGKGFAYPGGVPTTTYFNGFIDEVKIFNRALAATEVAILAGKYTLTITKDGTGSGTVTSSPTGIDCGSTCSYPFDDATHVNISAAAADGSVFDSWSGGVCSGNSSPCSVVMDEDKSVTATFKLKADFDATPKSGQAPMAVQFTDLSATGATSWAWTFGDGGTSTLQNPMHMYKTTTGYPVSYNVSLTANGATTTKNNYITLTAACTTGLFKIGSTFYSEYPTVQAVYEAMGDATLQIQAQAFGGNLLLDQTKTIKLQGGYDCGFTSNAGESILSDKLTIQHGKVTIDKLIIK